MNSGLGSERSRETLRRIRENITSGKWPLNSKIPTETELMNELGVGRSTVREAVRSLANLGMLEPAPHRGTFVRSRSPVSFVLADFVAEHDVEDVLAVRRALEIEASQSAALNRTDDQLERLAAAHEKDIRRDCSPLIERGHTPGQFHGLIFEAAGNQLLTDLYGGVMSGIRGLIRDGLVVSGATDSVRQADHAKLLEAITDGDPVEAAHAAAEHADRDLIATHDEN